MYEIFLVWKLFRWLLLAFHVLLWPCRTCITDEPWVCTTSVKRNQTKKNFLPELSPTQLLINVFCTKHYGREGSFLVETGHYIQHLLFQHVNKMDWWHKNICWLLTFVCGQQPDVKYLFTVRKEHKNGCQIPDSVNKETAIKVSKWNVGWTSQP